MSDLLYYLPLVPVEDITSWVYSLMSYNPYILYMAQNRPLVLWEIPSSWPVLPFPEKYFLFLQILMQLILFSVHLLYSFPNINFNYIIFHALGSLKKLTILWFCTEFWINSTYISNVTYYCFRMIVPNINPNFM